VVEEQQSYECKNVGCRGEKEFQDHSAKLWDNWGQNLPTNCKPCRSWRDKQKVIGVNQLVCKGCDQTRDYKPEYRISYHRNEGNWDEYAMAVANGQVCEQCMRSPHRVSRNRQEKRKFDFLTYERRKVEGPRSLGLSQEWKTRNFARPISISSSQETYLAIRYHGNRAKRLGNNEMEHIMKLDHDLLEGLGTNDRQTTLDICSDLALSCDEDVLQFRERDLIVKANLLNGHVIYLMPCHDSSYQWRLHTNYVSSNVEQKIESMMEKGNWTIDSSD
jgi:hypothetical protein